MYISDTNDNQNNAKEKKIKKKDFEQNQLKIEEHFQRENKEISPLLQEKLDVKLKKVKVLGAGASFGELALMEKKPRAATIKCDTDCHFAVLEKDHFNDILSIFANIFR